jgi:hypothetical protein
MTIGPPEFGVVAGCDVAREMGDVKGTCAADFNEIWDVGEFDCEDYFTCQFNKGF